MKRRHFIQTAGAAALGAPLITAPMIRSASAQTATVRWWYHFDNPQNTPNELIAQFEKDNPGIKIQAESIPWGGGGDYYTRLFAAIVAKNAPDCAMVKLSSQAQLLEMEALEPLDGLIKNWAGKADISDNIWNVNKAQDGKQYYMPLQYVVLYLYYRADWLQAAGLQPPKTYEEFLAAAKAMTKGDVSGFGMRGGGGGHDNWAPFVVGNGATFAKGGMVSEQALAGNRFYVSLARDHKVTPASAASDGFRQIVDGFKAERTGMIIHHIGSANELVTALGDKVSAVPVPRPANGKGWTMFGDESNALLSGSKNKDAAFKWISFLSSGANNVAFNKLTGQLPVTTSGATSWTLHPKRFVDASAASLPLAGVLPDSPKTADFARTVWPTSMQRALLGQVTPDDMMKTIEAHYNG